MLTLSSHPFQRSESFRSRSDTALEVLALRQQVAVLQRRRPRPIVNRLDRLFWTTVSSQNLIKTDRNVINVRC
jgi:hypothetical protein